MYKIKFDSKEIRVGYELPPLTRTLTQKKMDIFSAFSEIGVEPSLRVSGAFHTDEAYAKSKGLPGTLAQSMHYYTFMSEMMTAFFQEDWVKGGKLAMSFTRMVLAGDTITCRAVVSKMEKYDSNKTMVLFDVFCENQKGEKVGIGTASGLIRIR
jgi:hypothetical protein